MYIHHFDYYWSLLVDGKTQDLEWIYTLEWDRLFSLLPLNEAHREFTPDLKHYRKWVKWANGSFGRGELPEISDINGDKTAFLLIGGWFDLFCQDVIALYNQLNPDGENNRAKLVIGPFDHSDSPPPECDMNFGDWSSLNIQTLSNQWFDRWTLKEQNGVEDIPAVQFFLLGENRWISADSWPPEGVTEKSLYLHSSGSANSSDGDGYLDEKQPGDEPPDRFVYDPGNPVPTKGGILCCLRPMTKAGPVDQSEIEKRDDILVFSTGTLSEDVTVAGPVKLELYAATDARDTDFTGKLVDVSPNGKALNITDGIIRARFRNGMGAPDFITPGETVMYRINLGSTAVTFKKGHRIRLEVSSSNFPRFDRNMSTGSPIGTESVWKKAAQTIFHDAKRQSRLILTVADSL